MWLICDAYNLVNVSFNHTNFMIFRVQRGLLEKCVFVVDEVLEREVKTCANILKILSQELYHVDR